MTASTITETHKTAFITMLRLTNQLPDAVKVLPSHVMFANFNSRIPYHAKA